MFNSLFNKFFPTPDFLSMPSFGLDISDEALKFVKLVNTSNGIRVNRYGERKIMPGIVESGEIKNPKKLKEILLSLKQDEGFDFVRISLPERPSYLFDLKLNKFGLENIKESIEIALEEHIPIPAENAVFDYEIIKEDPQNLKIQVAAITKKVIDSYISLFDECNIVIKSLELEAQAISRAIIKSNDPETYMIVDFGENRSGIFIVSNNIIVFTSTLDMGGSLITNAIKEKLNINLEEAEELKKKYALKINMKNEDDKNKEIYSIILNNITILSDEIIKHFSYWHTHKNEDGKDNPSIKKIILCGGGSNLIGFSEYLSAKIKHQTEVANVWVNILDTEKYIPEISYHQTLSFAAAIGLALGDFKS
jgi:type IV pilus assembly protein PilM